MLNLNEIYNQEHYTKLLVEEAETETAKKVKDKIYDNLKKLGLSDEEIYFAVYDS